jgi:hypothetical protein
MSIPPAPLIYPAQKSDDIGFGQAGLRAWNYMVRGCRLIDMAWRVSGTDNNILSDQLVVGLHALRGGGREERNLSILSVSRA